MVSPYCAKQILDWVCGGASAARPAERWVALIDNSNNELSMSGYTRKSALFAEATVGSATMLNVTFGLTNSVDFVVRSIRIYDAQSSGNELIGTVREPPLVAQANGSGVVVANLALVLS